MPQKRRNKSKAIRKVKEKNVRETYSQTAINATIQPLNTYRAMVYFFVFLTMHIHTITIQQTDNINTIHISKSNRSIRQSIALMLMVIASMAVKRKRTTLISMCTERQRDRESRTYKFTSVLVQNNCFFLADVCTNQKPTIHKIIHRHTLPQIYLLWHFCFVIFFSSTVTM